MIYYNRGGEIKTPTNKEEKKMKDINRIKEEIENINERIADTFRLYNEGIYDEGTFKHEMTRLESARNTLTWVLK